MITAVILGVSVIVARDLYVETREQNTAQRKAEQDQRKAEQKQQVLLRRSIDQNTITTVYTMSLEVAKFLFQYPELRIYFDAIEDYRISPPKEDAARRRDRLDRLFDKESNATKQRVWQYCETLSDFFEYTFNLRDLLPASDWKAWWFYFSDAYDESHVLRAYMASRPDWYTINHVLALPKAARIAWFTEDARQIAERNEKKD